jgi:hypothetical protein
MDNLQQEYLDLGYIITEIEGVYYVQKQETFRTSETIAMPELRNKGWDNNIRAQ